MKKGLNFIFHFVVAIFLTTLTQIGGLLYLLSLFFFRRNENKRQKQMAFFVLLYIGATFFIVPLIAPYYGRVKIDNEQVKPRNFFYTLANRNYVKPELNAMLQRVGNQLNNQYPRVTLLYLDANFPFINQFPLLPHLSHDDGKKIDLCFIYETGKGLTNQKPSFSGYGAYSPPRAGEINQILQCENQGNWQYSFSKYVSFGVNNKLVLSEHATKYLIEQLVKQPETEKLFIEPHLKQRLNLQSNKVRFHGCQSVRHDDHIHIQIK